MTKVLPRSSQLASKLIFSAMTLLKDAPGQSMKGSDLLDLLPSQLVLDDWALEIIESNGIPRWRTYALFFSIDSVKAGYLTKVKGIWTLTAEGVKALSLGQEHYFHSAQNAYRNWRKDQLSKAGDESTEAMDDELTIAEQVPPEVRFDQLKTEINKTLAAEILERIKANSWQFFERLVIAVLLSMGYGRTNHGAQAFQRGSDGGIDGFINQDRLGLDVVYVQAKRWRAEQSVGRPDIQQFVGALAGRQASRGVFITTSRFTQEAREFVKNLNVRVILIDGEQLASLMIEYGVGVSTWRTFDLKRLDSDFFTEE